MKKIVEYKEDNIYIAYLDEQQEKLGKIMGSYCYGQFTEGTASPKFGPSHVHWPTGTSSIIMAGCVEGILGMRPDSHGLTIAPSVPTDWNIFSIEKDFRSKHLTINVFIPNHAENGFVKLVLNVKELEGNYISEEMMKEENVVELTMS